MASETELTQAQKVKAFLAKFNKELEKEGHRKMITASDIYIPPRQSSGILSLDVALGGGWSNNRWIEILGESSSGKTLCIMHTIAYNQSINPDYSVFWIASEPYQKDWAAKNGVDNDRVTVFESNNMELCMQKTIDAANAHIYDCIVMDSYPALIAADEAEKDMNGFTIGSGAKRVGQFFRKISDSFDDERPYVGFFVNQFRDKVGGFSPYGCLHADTLVNFVDGRNMRIKEVVDNKVTGKVWAFDEETQIFEARDIKGWAYNGEVEKASDYLHIETDTPGGSKNGRFGVTVTTEHELLTPSGWVRSKTVRPGDLLTTRIRSVFSEGTICKFLHGALIGDAHISWTSNNKVSASLRFEDSNDPEYAKWKVEKLSPVLGNFSVVKGFKGTRHISPATPELGRIKHILGRRNPYYFLNEFSTMGLALWIMDDAHYNTKDGHRRYELSVKRLSISEAHSVAKSLCELGYEVSRVSSDRTIYFSVAGSLAIADSIAEYIPECMQRKLPESHKNRYVDFDLSFTEKFVACPAKVLSVREASNRQMRSKGKYDLHIDGFHNYLAGGTDNGLVVHNTPKTEPGGKAKNYNFFQRVTVSRDDWIEETHDGLGKIKVGQTCKYLITKNKDGAPQKVAMSDKYFEHSLKGFRPGEHDKVKDIITMAIMFKVIDRGGGGWYYYTPVNGEKQGWKGRDPLVDAIRENITLQEEITDLTLKIATAKD